MPGRYRVAILLCTAQILAVGTVLPACAEDRSTPSAGQSATAPASGTAPAPETGAVETAVPSPRPAAPEPSATTAQQPPPAAEVPAAEVPAVEPLAAEAPAPAPVDPVVAIIRSKLADPDLRKGADDDDVAALEAFYARRTGAALWVTEMGLSAKAQSALFEIGHAGNWGLDPAAFELPQAGALPPSPEAQAIAEIKLDFAILKYARFARGGRFNPQQISKLLDQVPPVRDPEIVLTGIEAADAPDVYLRALQPQHEQFERLRQALLAARGKGGEGAASADSDPEIKRLIINMERWRWMPEDLGAVHVWNNSPEFMLYVVKDGKAIYADKTLVGTLNYATPVFSADLKTIVFNPDWNAPETVVVENLLPHLQRGNYSILKTHKLSVSYQGKPVDVSRVNWSRSNVLSYTFSQRGGPSNVLGKAKFLYPNKHVVYMHDTLPYRKKVFKQPVRMIGHECVRMEKPDRFAQVLLAEDKGWPVSKVKDLWDKGRNSAVAVDRRIPVHMVYFTAVVDEAGKVETYADVYGLDHKLAVALFGTAKGFPPPPPESKQPQVEATNVSRPASRVSGGSGIAGSLGFIDD